MANIYEQHKAAFAQVSAYVVTHKGERVATIAFKYPRDGAGRLYAYVHWLGVPMVRGWAGGYGYDKQSAACQHSTFKLRKAWEARMADREAPGLDERPAFLAFHSALANDGGSTWDTRLRNAGFDVLQAV